jgi:hypothetical protein
MIFQKKKHFYNIFCGLSVVKVDPGNRLLFLEKGRYNLSYIPSRKKEKVESLSLPNKKKQQG